MEQYAKPVIIAKNRPTGSYAAGCPTSGHGKDGKCRTCSHTR